MSDFLVNTNVAGAQYEPDVTVLSNGNYVVVWTSDDGLDAGGNPAAGIRAQLFSDDGTPIGSEILVNSIGEEVQSSPAVQDLHDGGFAVVWASQDIADWETSGTVIRGRIFDATGAAAAADFAVATAGDNQAPSLTALAGGNYLVTWTTMDLIEWSNDVRGQVIDATGVPVGAPFVVSATAEGEQSSVTSATLTDGTVVTAFVQLDESWNASVYVRLFDATATTPGVEVAVPGASPAEAPALAALADGGFVVMWTGEGGIYGQRFDASGATASSLFEATSQAGDGQNAVQVIGLPGGGYFVVWQAQDQSYLGESYVGDGVYSYAIRGRFYNEDGEAVAEDVVINTTTAGVQTQPRLSLLDDGRIVVAYQSGDGEQGAANGTAIRALVIDQPDSFVPNAEPTAFVATPTAATFSADTAVGTVVATLAATDPEGGTITYEVLNFAGGKFEVVGNEVRLRAPLDYEAAHSYDVLVRATDSAGNVVDTSFTIGVTDVAEPETMAVTATHGVTAGSANAMSITLADGRFVVAYQNQDASSTQAQIFTADGTASGSPITLQASDQGTEFAPSLAARPDGGFIAVWNVSGAIYMRAFDANLSGGAQVQVNSTAGSNSQASVAVFDDGSFVVAWRGNGTSGDGDGATVRVRLFAVDGTPAGDDFVAVSTTEGASSQTNQAVAALEGGRFVVTWTSNDSEGANADGGTVIRARVFEDDGTPVGSDFQVNASATSYQNTPSVTALKDGGFLVVWQSDDGGDGGYIGAFAGSRFVARGQIFDADGDPVGAELVLNDIVDGQQFQVRATQLDDGTIAVLYFSAESAKDAFTADTVRLALFDEDGTPIGGSFVVAKDFEAQNLTFGNPQVTALADGRVAVSWESLDDGHNSVQTRVVDIDALEPPEALSLSSTSISEGARAGSVVGVLSATDPEGGAITWSLVAGQGDNDNFFALRTNGDGSVSVVLKAPLDFESGAASAGVFELVVKAIDPEGNATTKTFEIQSTDESFMLTATPTGKNYASVMENVELGQEIGFIVDFDDRATPLAATLLDDAGGLFSLTTRVVGGDTRYYLTVDGPLDHETADLHSVTIRATGVGGVTQDKTFDIHVLDAAEAGDAARGTITIDASTALAATNGGVNWDTYLEAQYAKVTPSLPAGVVFAPGTATEFVYALTGGALLSLKGTDLAYWWADPVTGEDVHVVAGTINSLSFGTGASSVLTNPELTISGLDLTSGSSLLDRIYGEANITAVTWMYGPDANHPADIEFVKAKIASYAQNFVGSSGADTYSGTIFGDTIAGNAGLDRLAGRGGDDSVDGGEGDDTAVFSGSRSDYTVTYNADGTWTVKDNRTGGENDGTDTLDSVEFAEFVDQTLTLANEAPIASNDSAATLVDQPRQVNVLANDTDSDGTLDPTTVTIVDGPDHGTVSVNAATGMVIYTPVAGYAGGDSFTYTVKDNFGRVSMPGTVSLDVVEPYALTPGDDVFSGDSLGWSGAPIAVNGLGGHDYIVTSNAGNQPDTIFGGDGNDLIFTGRGDDYVDGGAGDDVIHARAGNETVIGGTGDDTFVVRFTDVGTTTIIDDDGTLFHGTFRPATYPASWSPAPGATNGFEIGGTAAFVSAGVWNLALSDGATSHDLTLSWSGGDLTIRRGSDAQTVVIKDYVNGTFGITLDNDAPTGLALSAASVVENAANGTVVGTLSATDPEGQPLTFTLTDSAGGRFALSTAGGVTRLVVAGPLDFEAAASHTVTVKVSDGLAEVSQDFVIAVGDVDETVPNTPPAAPVLSGGSASEGALVGAVVGVLSSTDPDGDALSYALTDDAGGRFGLVTEGGVTRVVVAGALDYETATSHDVTVKVSDGKGGETSGTFTIAVTDVLESTVKGGKGTKGADIIVGGGGNNRIDGGKGDDIIAGGAGRDVLKGGKGADTFVFQFASDSTAKARGRDLIKDFSRKQGDKIDVSAIDPLNDDGVFDFIGKKKFGKEAGELRSVKQGGQTVIYGDFDGDGKADFSIGLAKAMTLKEADFIL